MNPVTRSFLRGSGATLVALAALSPTAAVAQWAPPGCPQPTDAEQCSTSSPQFDACIAPQLVRGDSACIQLMQLSIVVPAGCPSVPTIAQCTTPPANDEERRCFHTPGTWSSGGLAPCDALQAALGVRASSGMREEVRMEPRTLGTTFATDVRQTDAVAPGADGMSTTYADWTTSSRRVAILPPREVREDARVVDAASYEPGFQRPVPAMFGGPGHEPWYAYDAQGVRSCSEYVYESFYDVEVFRDAIRDASEPRTIWSVAYGAASARTSIGTRHADGSQLATRDGRPVGQLWTSAVPRNLFYTLDTYDTATLATVLRAGTYPYVQRFAAGDHDVMPTFGWYREVEALATRNDPSAMQRIAPVWSPERAYGYSPEELEYLWDLQQRFVSALESLAAMPVVVCVPHDDQRGLERELDGWRDVVRAPGSVLDIGRIDRGYLTTATLVSTPAFLQTSPIDGVGGIGNIGGIGGIGGGIGGIGGGGGIGGIGGIPRVTRALERTSIPTTMSTMSTGAGCSADVVRRANAAREAIYTDIREILEEADRWGCFREGPSGEYVPGPCDVSYSRFAEDVNVPDMVAKRQAEYAACLAGMDDAYSVVESRELVFAYNDVSCPGADETHRGMFRPANEWHYPRTNSAATLRYLRRRTQSLALASYCQGQRIRDALRRTRPELVGADGQVRLPGFDHRGGNTLGDRSLFALGYQYQATFDLNTTGDGRFSRSYFSSGSQGETTCNAPLRAFGGFAATATVFKSDLSLVDAQVSTLTSSGHLRILGNEVFSASFSSDGTQRNMAASASRESTLAHGVIVVLGIPISYRAGIAGSVGVEGFAGTTRTSSPACDVPRIELGFTPSARLEGFLSAAVDVVIARAGVKGRLTVLDLALPVTVTAGFEQREIPAGGEYLGNVLSSPMTVPHLGVLANADLRLTTLSGSISAFAEVGIGPFSKSAEITMLSWPGLSVDTALVHWDYAVSWNDLAHAF
ncbi:hypothetical protein [Sandaracinus amylolyticus]|uniref:hypothetical protein n=1 Tax=Sandaracinus amylolyticus TaxID=927083 RepID=UPI001F23E3BB|nr:hypothetical protein [Sandaracinus amylolyticus]UJR85234.1 Hypothetical protein I5071_73140 [Sandaracinus amylolyticus]